MIFRVRYYNTVGQHVHCRLFVAPAPNRTFQMLGEFTVYQGPEFAALQKAFSGAEFIDEDAAYAANFLASKSGTGATFLNEPAQAEPIFNKLEQGTTRKEEGQ